MLQHLQNSFTISCAHEGIHSIWCKKQVKKCTWCPFITRFNNKINYYATKRRNTCITSYKICQSPLRILPNIKKIIHVFAVNTWLTSLQTFNTKSFCSLLLICVWFLMVCEQLCSCNLTSINPYFEKQLPYCNRSCSCRI